jgi:hypothetical protein
MKINIVGSGRGWQDAPFDPENEPCWGFYSTAERRHVDVIFDMHPIPDMLSGKRQADGRTYRNPQATEKMIMRSKANNVPIFSLEAYDGCIRYPIEKVVKKFNTSFFSSGPCYVMALALYMGATEINIYGMVLVGREYKFEKEGLLYWIGRAEGMGVKVVVNQPSSIFELTPRVLRGKTFSSELYGYEVPQEDFIKNVLNYNLIHHEWLNNPQKEN